MPVIATGEPVRTAMVLFHNRFAAPWVTIPTEGRINVTDPATWNSWVPNGLNQNLAYTFPSGRWCDTVCLASHTLASNGATVAVRASNDNVNWTTVSTRYTPTTDEDLIFTFPPFFAQYWVVDFTGGGFSIGVVWGGSRLEFPHPPVDSYTPLHRARRYTKMFNDSLKGQFLGNRVMAAGAETEVDLGFVTRNWLEGNISGFETHYNQGSTFFYAGCPALYPRDMGYCRANGEDAALEIEFTEGRRLATLSFGVESFVG